MRPRCSSSGVSLFLPFLYPTFFRAAPRSSQSPFAAAFHSTSRRPTSDSDLSSSPSDDAIPTSRLNPPPDDYSASNFADKAKISIHAGPGGHGCISFVRELFISEGPPNGGDGGHGGNIYIQAIPGQTSLHKLARHRILRAGRGKSGQGSSRGGARGEDIVIEVPLGTVVREIDRHDPMVEEQLKYRASREKYREYRAQVKKAEEAAAARAEALGEESLGPDPASLPEAPENPSANKFVLYPGISRSEKQNLTFPRVPRRDRLYTQPEPPIHLDLSSPTPRPILLAAGGLGGLGNPHFASKDVPRPLFATKGEAAVSMQIELELKLLADVGLVGLPNAGKSTLLRALTNSRARVGNWAFTTLQPNIGTVVLDNNKGRPMTLPRPSARLTSHQSVIHDAERGPIVLGSDNQPLAPLAEPRTRFTVADIPGLIEGAHLDRGLGVAFLRHVERAGVLAFVIDLSAGDAVKNLKSLWNEVGLYARMRDEEEREREIEARIDWAGDGSGGIGEEAGGQQGPPSSSKHVSEHNSRHIVADEWHHGPDSEENSTTGLHIASKPWFVIATKGDLPETQDNFSRLQAYLSDVTAGREPHPSGIVGKHEDICWTRDCAAIPVSAIRGHGVDRVVHWTVGLLDA